MYQKGKLDNLIQEADAMKVDIIGVSEVRWTGSGSLLKGNHQFIFFWWK